MGNKPVMRMVAQKALKVFIMSFTLIVQISSLLHMSYPILNLLLQVLTFFATNECKWSNDNVLKLKEELTAVDKKTFNFDLSTLNLADFMDDYVKVFLFGVFHLFRLFFVCQGTRQYVFKEDPGTMEQARCHSNKMFWVEKCLQVISTYQK